MTRVYNMSEATRQRMIEHHKKALKALEKPRKPVSEEVFQKRMRVWRHNSFTGYVSMLQKNMRTILSSSSATDEAKTKVNQMLELSFELAELLKTRKD